MKFVLNWFKIKIYYTKLIIFRSLFFMSKSNLAALWLELIFHLLRILDIVYKYLNKVNMLTNSPLSNCLIGFAGNCNRRGWNGVDGS